MKNRLAAAFTTLVLATCVILAASAATAVNQDQKKQTTLGKYVTAVEALAMWEGHKETVAVVDCRPVAAWFYNGHTTMAVNIPLRFWTGKYDPEKNTFIFSRNKNFVRQVEDKVGRGKTILVVSRAGLYSARAVDLLAEAGFTDVYTVTDGFVGWQKAKLPTSRKLDPALVFQATTP